MEKSQLIKKAAAPIILILIILGIWQLSVSIFQIPIYILPSPTDIISSLIENFSKLAQEASVTLMEATVGMLIAFILGAAIAILMDAFDLIKISLYPVLVVSQTVPVIVLAPIFIIYFGFGMAPKIITVVLMCFFPIVVSFCDGLSKVDRRMVDLVRSFGAGRIRTYTLVKIPAAADALFSGLKIAATYSIIGAVVGEWLASNSGLGYYMLIAKNGYMLDKVFACILVIIILSLLMNGIIKFIQYLTSHKQHLK